MKGYAAMPATQPATQGCVADRPLSMPGTQPCMHPLFKQAIIYAWYAALHASLILTSHYLLLVKIRDACKASYQASLWFYEYKPKRSL